ALMKTKRNAQAAKFVVCVRNDGYPESLELRKLYRVLPDAKAAKVAHLRVIDESGEDYLYPRAFFAPVTLAAPVRRALLAA
ncbi:MAG: hypothetical protein ACREJC_02470, partial [Tepidisphaeraceae bacterium]